MVDVSRRSSGVLCQSRDLLDGGKGIRFTVRRRGEALPAFVIRYRGRPHAYLNQCAHQSVELDWNEGDFFDREGECLICATHGARYWPATGACAGGRCNGRGLVRLEVVETGSQVCLAERDGVHLLNVETQGQPSR